MKIVLEGAKGTGKSTIARHLRKKYNLDYHHSSHITKNDLEYHMALLNDERDLVLDRFQVGEIIYSQYFNRTPKLRVREMLMMPSLVPNTLYIVLYSSKPSLLQNRVSKRDNGSNPSDLRGIIYANKQFEVIGRLMALEQSNVLVIDVAELSQEELLEDVDNAISQHLHW